jgi:two-component system, cell cycle response regulator
MNIVPLRDAQGKVTHFAAIERDVTVQRQTQAMLQSMANSDVLTGLANRRAFEDALHREIRNAVREVAPLCVLAFDLDHFKRINDEYGHAVGDAVLCEVAARCEQQLRSRDVLARVGGEEFLVLLPRTHLRLGHHVAECLRRAIADVPLLVLGVSVDVTASFGVALHDAADADGSLALRRADGLMYAAKATGRNRTHSEGGSTVMPGWSGASEAARHVHRLR